MRIISPSDTPAGMTTCTSSSRFATPCPLQMSHWCSGTSPRPRQRGHVRVVVKLPKNVFRDSRMFPFPLHELHVVRFVPFLAPVPSHAPHTLILAMSILRSVPNIASRNGSSISTEISRPLLPAAVPLALPPKNSPKISPRSNSWSPKFAPPCAKSEKSNPPPNPPRCLDCPPANAPPYASYSARFFLSESTAYASLASLNFFSSPPFLSGWYL